MLFLADVGTPSIDRHSGQRHARNVAKWPGEGGYTESTTGEVQWPSTPYDGSGNCRPPQLDTAGQSVDVTGGWASFMAGFPVPWCMCRNAGWEHDGGDKIADQTPGTGNPQAPPSDAAGRSADISVLFLVCYRGRVKRPHLHCWADAVA